MPELATENTPVAAPVAGPPADEVEASQLLPDDGLSLDDLDSASEPKKPEPATPPPAVEKPAEQQQPAVAATAPTTDAARHQQLVEEHAKKLGIAPNDPQFAGVLKQLADKDLYIEQLKSGTAGKPPEAAQPADYLTEYEKQLLQKSAPPETPVAEPPKPTQTAAPAEAAPAKIADIIASWKTPADPYTALNEAWSAGDLSKVADVENAMFVSRAAEVVPRMVEQLAGQIIAKALGEDFMELVPEFKGAFQSSRAANDAKFAVAELKKSQNYADIDKLYDSEGEGEIEVSGQKFPRTVMNRIVSENPWITNIQPDPRITDPRGAERSGHMERLRAIHRIYRAEQAAKSAIDPKQAQSLVETGKVIQQKAESDRTRQALNAGSGATTAAGQTPSRSSYVKEIIAARREGLGMSLDEL